MKTLSSLCLSALILISFQVQSSTAQNSADEFRNQFNGHYDYATRVLELAKAMPADKYDWRPMEGVSSVAEVYTHIAHYNYALLNSNLDVEVPDDVDLDNIESLTDKDEIVAILESSIQHVKNAVDEMPDSKFAEKSELYGRTVTGQGVLLQLLTHLSEHVGQSIAYARMNKIVPPWNR